MNGLKKIIGVVLFAIFTVFTGFVVIECAMADLTGHISPEIVGMYEFVARIFEI